MNVFIYNHVAGVGGGGGGGGGLLLWQAPHVHY